MIVAGFDPAIRHFGVSLHKATLVDGQPVLEPYGGCVLVTKAPAKKRKVTKTSADLEAYQIIARSLMEILREHDVSLIAAEEASYPRHARAKILMGAAWGVIATLSVVLGVPVVTATPQKIKLGLCGKQSASKTEVIAALDVLYPDVNALATFELEVPDGELDHFYDSIGAAHVCRADPMVLALLQAEK